MTRYRLALAAALAALALGCTQHTLGPPSADYKKAKDKYLALLAKDGSPEVFADSELANVQAMLALVPADSVDADAAHSLQATIAKGIADNQVEAAAQQKAAAEAAKVPLAVAGSAPSDPSPTPVPAEVPAAADAGPQPVAAGPSEGMSEAEFQKKFGECFNLNSAYTDDKGAQGQAYAVADSCRAKYPALGSKLVLISAGKVASILPQSAITGTQTVTLSKSTQPPTAPVLPTAAPAVPAPPPAAPDPNTIDRRVGGADGQVNAPSNLNSDLDDRSKLPGQ